MVVVDLPRNRQHQFRRDVLHPLVGHLIPPGVPIPFEIPLKLSQSDLITILKFPKVLPLLLHRIIRKVYKAILQVLQSELLTRSAHIPVLVPVPLDRAIDTGKKDKATDVELATIVEERVLHVFLDDEGTVGPAALGDQGTDLGESGCDLDAVAAVGVLPRLADPYVRSGRGRFGSGKTFAVL